MDWRIKALLQKVLSTTRLGDKLNHIPATLSKNYHQNVTNYQIHESLRKFSLAKIDLNEKCNALEIGTGYSLVSPIVLYLLGFHKIVTVDISRDASFKTFKKQIQYVKNSQFFNDIVKNSKFEKGTILNKLNAITGFGSLKEVLGYCNIDYLAPYTLDLVEQIEEKYHYICSQVVFEHVEQSFLEKLIPKIKELLHNNGYTVHTVNFIDHFANPGFFEDRNISEFNFLRYSDKYWRFWAGNSIAHTNRLSYLFYLNLFKEYGFELIDFIGENYREHKPFDVTQIHNDIKNKYPNGTDFSKLMDYQRGIFVYRKK